MAIPYFVEQTLDDVMRESIKAIISNGGKIHPTKGSASELTGVTLEITDPRARLSRTETRGKPFSCLGELCWYLSKSNDSAFISYYIPMYEEYDEGGIIFGGYGPRLFSHKNVNQVANVINILRNKPDSRQAVIQIFDATDIVAKHKDTPCTCTLQFMIREDALHMLTYMRSNDAYWGLPHDVFSFTLLQEIIARSLSVELGVYKHMVGSLHLYERNREAAEQFLDEGWQATIAMPIMPNIDPWPAITTLLMAESAIRTRGEYDITEIGLLDPYWQDFIRLLQVFRASKDDDSDCVVMLRDTMASDIYRPFIEQRLRSIVLRGNKKGG